MEFLVITQRDVRIRAVLNPDDVRAALIEYVARHRGLDPQSLTERSADITTQGPVEVMLVTEQRK